MTRPVVVGLAFRDGDAAPMALGRALAELAGAPLVVAHVYRCESLAEVAMPGYEAAIRRQAESALTELRARMGDAADVTVLGGVSHALVDGAAAPVIVLPRGAERPADALLGRHAGAVA